jgi:hypothetical protein
MEDRECPSNFEVTHSLSESFSHAKYLCLAQNWDAPHLRFEKDRLLWSRVNDYDKDKIGLVTWSRYLTQPEGDDFWREIQEIKQTCP